MKRNIISIAAAGVLATAISVLAAGSPAAFAVPFNGVSGEGYRCKSGLYRWDIPVCLLGVPAAAAGQPGKYEFFRAG